MKNLAFLTCITVVTLSGCIEKKSNSGSRSADLEYGERLDSVGKKDSAFHYFNRVVSSSSDSLEKGQAYNYMGKIQYDSGDYFGAQENFLSSLKSLDEQDSAHFPCLSSDYNTLGNTEEKFKHYDSAVLYYKQAIKFGLSDEFNLVASNNIALAYQKKAEYNKAIVLFDSILKQNISNPILLARVISNLGRTKWLQNPNYDARGELSEALRLRQENQYKQGEMTSYGHISDYYAPTNRDSGLLYAYKMYSLAKTDGDPGDVIEALDKLILLSPSKDSIISYYLNRKSINDSLQTARSAAKNQFALIRFNVEKIKAESEQRQKKNIKQRAIMTGIILVALFVVIILIINFRTKRKRIRQESENAIRTSKLQTSQKVHDIVANGLYRIINELEHKEVIDKESLLNRIEELYGQSRDISYEDTPISHTEAYSEKIYQLLNSFDNDNTEVILVGNEQKFWDKVTKAQKEQVRIVLQELMINMQKHSEAKNVVVRFKQENSAAYVFYKDDGVGFAREQEFGNGLKNTVSRIKSLNGEVNFGSGGGEGVTIEIRFPLEPN